MPGRALCGTVTAAGFPALHPSYLLRNVAIGKMVDYVSPVRLQVTAMPIEDDKMEFMRLIADEHNEQIYQDFLESHTRFIPREFLQNHGVAQHLVLRKLSFGADYKTDFFYFSKSSDDWNAVFHRTREAIIEILQGVIK
jgi:hypothetical protein